MISVLLPIHNEEENLEPLMREIVAALEPAGHPFEIVAVDDGSKDQSPLRLRAMAQKDPRIKVILFRRNAGQTAAFDAGFRAASGEIIVTMDADLQNDPQDIPKLVERLNEGYDFVTGWRKKRQDGLALRLIPSWIANALIRKVTGTKIHDLGCSLKAYRREIVEELRLYGEMHRFISVLVEDLGARVSEIEVHHRPRVAGKSKYSLTRAFKVLLDLMTVWFMSRYRTKPLYVFGGFGAICLFAGGTLFALVLWQKFGFDVKVHRNPLFIIGTILSVLSIQFFSLGLVAELVIRTYFESSRRVPYSVLDTINFQAQQLGPQSLASFDSSDLESFPKPNHIPQESARRY